jgi:methyl-accepting chemotaxis protein
MKINDKLSQLKKTIEEIKNISEKLGNDNVFETKIDELNKEISRLKKGISESAEELEEFLGEENA